MNSEGRNFSFKLNTEQKEIKEAFYLYEDKERTRKKTPFMFINGEAGTGKTGACLQIALDALMKKEIEYIYIVRSMISQEELGYLKGDAKEKTESYHIYLKEMMFELLPKAADRKNIEKRIETGQIVYVPIAFMRGITLKNCCVLIEEYQNLSKSVLSLIIGRAGINCTMMFTGDKYQIDLPKMQESCVFSVEKIKNDRSVYHKVLKENHRDPNIRRIIGKLEDRAPEMTDSEKYIFKLFEELEGDEDEMIKAICNRYDFAIKEAINFLNSHNYFN